MCSSLGDPFDANKEGDEEVHLTMRAWHSNVDESDDETDDETDTSDNESMALWINSVMTWPPLFL